MSLKIRYAIMEEQKRFFKRNGSTWRQESKTALFYREGSHTLIEKPGAVWEASRELRAQGEAMTRISRMLHDHSRKLEIAVEATTIK